MILLSIGLYINFLRIYPLSLYVFPAPKTVDSPPYACVAAGTCFVPLLHYRRSAQSLSPWGFHYDVCPCPSVPHNTCLSNSVGAVSLCLHQRDHLSLSPSPCPYAVLWGMRPRDFIGTGVKIKREGFLALRIFWITAKPWKDLNLLALSCIWGRVLVKIAVQLTLTSLSWHFRSSLSFHTDKILCAVRIKAIFKFVQ